MESSSGNTTERASLLAELGEQLGMPVIAIAASWEGDNTVNLAEEAARAFVSVLEKELDAADDEVDSIGLFLLGRGGLPVFAEGVWRVLSGRGIASHAIVPYRADGVFTLLALAAQRTILHPYGSLGAYDKRPLGRVGVRLDTALVAEMPGDVSAAGEGAGALAAEIAYQRHQAKLSHHLMERIVGGSDSGLGARIERTLGANHLGWELGLACDELDRLGVECEAAGAEAADLIWQLYGAYERKLEILEPPTPRYTQSEVADEVEFEPAVGLCGAIIEGPNHRVHYELDTGSPDPDTNVLKGRWLWEMLRQVRT